MDANDPRHGTTAGWSRHRREHDTPCEPCRQAWNNYRLRYVKERTLGYARMVPVDHGGAWKRIDKLRRDGATYAAIGNALGLAENHVYRIHKRIIATIRPETWHKILGDADLDALNQPTHLGTVRRARALHANGWPGIEIGRRAGVCKATMNRLLAGHLSNTEHATRQAIKEVFDDLWDQHPPRSKHTARAKKRADREGWPTPLAFDCIDSDPDPVDWHYIPTDRATAVAEMVARGDNITTVCRALNLSRNTFLKWCENNGRRDVYRLLASREGDWNARGRYGRKGTAA